MSAAPVVNLVGSLLLGAMVFLVGWWGRRHVAALVPPTLPPDEREKRERTLRRGALTCQAVGVLFAVVGAVAVML